MATVPVRIPAADGGDFEAWLATPASGRGPGMVVLAEVYNANPWARSVAERFAAAGYVAIVPDLYWRQEPGVYLPYTPEGRERARTFGQAMDMPHFVADLAACAAWLRRRPDCSGRVGATGFCLGGKLVWVGLADRAVDAGVAYYASGIEPHLDKGARIDLPLLMHFGSLDHRLPPELYRRVCERLAGKPHASTFWYEGADHGFNRDGHPPYHPEAAALAWKRSLAFFARHLGGAAS